MNKQIFYGSQLTIALTAFFVAPCIAMDEQAGSSRPNYISVAAEGLLGESKLCAHFGMDMEQRDEAGKTPLMLAVARGDEAMARLLIENGASVNTKEAPLRGPVSHSWTPLMFAVAYHKEGCVRLLIANGARVNEQDARGITALDMARAEVWNCNNDAGFYLMAEEDRIACKRRCEAIVQMLATSRSTTSSSIPRN